MVNYQQKASFLFTARNSAFLYRESGVDQDVSLAYPTLLVSFEDYASMSDAKATAHSEKRRAEQPANANAVLVLADGTVFGVTGLAWKTMLLAKSASTHQ